MGGRGWRAAGNVSTFKETFERRVEGDPGGGAGRAVRI